ncbi:MAG: polysaccharide deacetylase family protein [Blautia sp.]
MPISRINTMLFPEGKRKALTLSYDDGVVQDRRLVKLMEKYEVKGTFNLNSGLFGRNDSMKIKDTMVDISTIADHEVAELYQNFEVATHGSKHSALTGYGAAALEEILEDRRMLESLMPYMVQGHAYPFGLYDEQVKEMLKNAGIRYARTVNSTKKFEIPRDFLAWNPTCHHGDQELMDLAKRFCEEESLFGQPQLFYLWGHSYEFDANQNWDVIEKLLSYVSEFREKIWMATNGEIVDYITAYRSLVFSADGRKVYNPSICTVWMESLNQIYEIPSGKTVQLN